MGAQPILAPWRCANCGSAADGLIKTCKCPTMVGCRDDENGRRESTWLVTREQDERRRLTDAAPNMLAALRALLEQWDAFETSSGNQEEAYHKLAKYARPAWGAARAAIAKATTSEAQPDDPYVAGLISMANDDPSLAKKEGGE